MTGLHKFLICLLAVVVAVSLGVTVYYFARSSNEVLSLSSTALSENIGDEFTVTINQEHANKRTELKLVSDKEDIVEYVGKDAKGLTYTFKAKAAGHANIKLVTSNEDYSGSNSLLCGVDVADGSANNPYYIRNAEDLLKITAADGYGIDKHYRQIANVDLNGKTFSSIGSTEANAFTGSYNGNEFTISNMTLQNNDVYAGLFGVIGDYAVVSNVKLSAVSINGGNKYVGAIAGLNKGKILDCEATDASLTTSMTSASYIGGIAAVNNNRVITSSFNGEIKNAEFLGGVVALNNGARVQDCYARGEFVPAATSKMGGVVANNFAVSNNRANVVNCYSTIKNKDTTNSNMGMIAYSNINSDATTTLTNENSIANRVYGNHYANAAGQTYTGIYSTADVAAFVSAIADKTRVQSYATFAANGTAATWNFTNIWSISSTQNDGYPTLKSRANVYVSNVFIPGVEDSEDPTPPVVDYTVITTPAQLNALANQETLSGYTYSWAENYSLGADINLGNANWSSMRNFEGSFDGKGHTISNFTITAGEDYYVGFANVLAGTIKNVKFNNVTVNASGNHEFGVVAGQNKGYVYNVEVNGLTVTNSASFGGIVASNINLVKTVKVTGLTATINGDFGGIAFNNSDSAVIEGANVVKNNDTAINANAGNLGGIVAINNGAVLNATTDVSYNNSTNKASRLGGIAAYNIGKLEQVTYNGSTLALTTTAAEESSVGAIAGKNEGIIQDSYVTSVSSVTINGGNNAYAGAIAGVSSGDITHVIATVNTISSNAYAGGLAGAVNGGTISASGINNTATINAKYVGGLAGTMNSGTITNSFTKATLNGSEESCGMSCAIKSGARVENCYIGSSFANDASGRKFETQTKIRQNQGGSVSNNVINESSMGGCKKGDSKRQYSNWYIPVGLMDNVWFEFNTPDDNLYGDDSCKSISLYTGKNWDASIWTFADGSEPTII